MGITSRLAGTLRDRWVEARKHLRQPLPLILHEELYVYFDEWCRIVEANVYDKTENAEVVIENRSGTRTQVEFSELSWRPNPDIVNAVSKRSMTRIIEEGPSTPELICRKCSLRQDAEPKIEPNF